MDWSLLIIFALIAGELGLAVFPRWHADWHPALIWTTALAAALAFFASILAHELSHAIVANARGIPVRAITLFLFGGIAHLEAEPDSPKSEFLVAIVGPLTSLVIGLSATFAALWLAGDPLRAAAASGDLEATHAALTLIGPGATLLLWLGPINVLLALFNVIPGFPLDGGRVLRSILWAITGNLRKATRWASRVGQLFAWTLMAFGVIELFAGALISGLWLLLIGWFLNNAARASYQYLLVREGLEDVPISRVMRSSLARVNPGLSVEQFIRDYALPSEQLTFPVESTDGRLLGLVSLEQIGNLHKTSWANTPVAEIMLPAEKLSTLPATAEAGRALKQLMRGEVDPLVVSDGDHLLGLVSRSDLLRWLNVHERAEFTGS
ncbi:site-2 protease family protein [Enhygromyxa salina]|uniref:Zinc metalloprotease n=1 Tax=Enhygromyxa salina TaxID=215803 RepID=A0A2S9XPI6_9BACT|nr:site-2 protease family protein [Enhygromyxa salina]PRP94776.1 putative zinc metalloprotease Rip3 [Enhygromyxa salina]